MFLCCSRNATIYLWATLITLQATEQHRKIERFHSMYPILPARYLVKDNVVILPRFRGSTCYFQTTHVHNISLHEWIDHQAVETEAREGPHIFSLLCDVMT